ncbi:TetR/AcrR family transcriptional regulator [Streptomyces pratensis]|uniref:TetR/AcrR family transcriptional regulator n=1 Tax=Streptomyces pratensis TaxID=1169025 RepID=UPI0036331EED
MEEFSRKGLHGGSTVAIAKRVGISHPNLFRLFSTKKELFRAVLNRLFETIGREMLHKGEATGDPTRTMEDAWGGLMADRTLMLMLLQGYATCDDPEVRELMHEATRDIFERVEATPGLDADKAHAFSAEGMLYMAAAALDLPSRAPDDAPWAERFLSSG